MGERKDISEESMGMASRFGADTSSPIPDAIQQRASRSTKPFTDGLDLRSPTPILTTVHLNDDTPMFEGLVRYSKDLSGPCEWRYLLIQDNCLLHCASYIERRLPFGITLLDFCRVEKVAHPKGHFRTSSASSALSSTDGDRPMGGKGNSAVSPAGFSNPCDPSSQRNASANSSPLHPTARIFSIRITFLSFGLPVIFYLSFSAEDDRRKWFTFLFAAQNFAIKNKFHLYNDLGQGSSAKVRLAKYRKTEKWCALKVFSRSWLRPQMVREVQAMKIASRDKHANVVQLLEVFETKDNIVLVMEPLMGGELFGRILKNCKNGNGFSEHDAARFCRDIASGIRYLHSRGIIHRDIKPENLLFNTEHPDARIKIMDLGLCDFFQNENHIFHDDCGTLHYVAPEVLDRSYTCAADMWSFGVVLYILLCGAHPFQGNTKADVFAGIRRGPQFQEQSWRSVSPSARDLVQRLLAKDPQQRLTPDQVLQHDWIVTGGATAAQLPARGLTTYLASRTLGVGTFASTNALPSHVSSFRFRTPAVLPSPLTPAPTSVPISPMTPRRPRDTFESNSEQISQRLLKNRKVAASDLAAGAGSGQISSLPDVQPQQGMEDDIVQRPARRLVNRSVTQQDALLVGAGVGPTPTPEAVSRSLPLVDESKQGGRVGVQALDNAFVPMLCGSSFSAGLAPVQAESFRARVGAPPYQAYDRRLLEQQQFNADADASAEVDELERRMSSVSVTEMEDPVESGAEATSTNLIGRRQ